MTEESYKAELAGIQQRIEGVDFWCRLNGSEYGRKMIADLRSRKQNIRDLYTALDASSEKFNQAFCCLQGREQELDGIIGAMARSEETRKALDSSFELLQNTHQQLDRDSSAQGHQGFLSKKIKSEGKRES